MLLQNEFTDCIFIYISVEISVEELEGFLTKGMCHLFIIDFTNWYI